MAMVAANEGASGNRDESLDEALRSADVDVAIDAVMAFVRKRMTRSLAVAINVPQGRGQLEFHLGKAFDNLERWFGPK